MGNVLENEHDVTQNYTTDEAPDDQRHQPCPRSHNITFRRYEAEFRNMLGDLELSLVLSKQFYRYIQLFKLYFFKIVKILGGGLGKVRNHQRCRWSTLMVPTSP